MAIAVYYEWGSHKVPSEPEDSYPFLQEPLREEVKANDGKEAHTGMWISTTTSQETES